MYTRTIPLRIYTKMLLVLNDLHCIPTALCWKNLPLLRAVLRFSAPLRPFSRAATRLVAEPLFTANNYYQHPTSQVLPGDKERQVHHLLQ